MTVFSHQTPLLSQQLQYLAGHFSLPSLHHTTLTLLPAVSLTPKYVLNAGPLSWREKSLVKLSTAWQAVAGRWE